VGLRFAHRALQAEQEPIVEVRGLVKSIFIEDQGVRQGTQFQQPMPVCRVPCESRHFEAHDQARAAQTHITYEPLKPLAVRRGGAGLTEVRIDDDDLLDRPAERDGALAERILPLRALGVFQHLPERGLADVQIRRAPQMARRDFSATCGLVMTFPLKTGGSRHLRPHM
jgi:hypothetical protein